MISVHTTVPDDGTADRLARELVKDRVAACVNAHPVSSTYRWDGEVIEEDEVALEIKTALPYDAVRERVEELHPYDVPSIVGYDPVANEDYADWVRRSTRTED